MNTIVANNTDSDFFWPDVFAGTSRKIISQGNNRLTTTGPNYEEHATDHVGPVDYVVTSVIDTFDGSSDPLFMTVRDAIHIANESIGAEEIWLPAWDFVLTLQRTNQPTDTDPSYGDLDVKDSLEIRGINGSTSVAWLTSAVADEVFELVGDYDLSGEVDLSDNILWHTSDGDDDGVTGGDQGDYDAWEDHFGNTLSLSGVTVA
jgi:hypothetical protein